MNSAYRRLAALPAWQPHGATPDAQKKWLQEVARGMEDPDEGDHDGDNRAIPSGFTYFGQFIDHDLTFSLPDPIQAWRRPQNARTPALDLDCVYGGGPSVRPELFDQDAPGAARSCVFALGIARAARRRPCLELDLPRRRARFAQVVGMRARTQTRVRMTADSGPWFADVLQAVLGRTPTKAEVDEGFECMTKSDVEVRPEDVIERVGVTWARVCGSGLIRTVDGSSVPSPDSVDTLGDLALIADVRNDEHLIIGQLHLAFLKLHNELFAAYMKTAESPQAAFEQARRELTWHYQWVIVHDFLPLLVGQDTVDRLISRGSQPFRFVGERSLPLEFAFAAYRFGHALVRGRYTLNDTTPEPVPVFAAGPQTRDRDDLRGGQSLPTGWTVRWGRFLDPRDACIQYSRRIRPRLAPTLERGMQFVQHESLAYLNLHKGWRVGLPSGPALAKALKARVLPPWERASEADEPLWHYVLREALEQHEGGRLGDLGTRLVAEVLVGMIRDDPSSYRSDPKWRPSLPHGSADFGLLDLVKAAGMPV